MFGKFVCSLVPSPEGTRLIGLFNVTLIVIVGPPHAGSTEDSLRSRYGAQEWDIPEDNQQELMLTLWKPSVYNCFFAV